MREAPNNCCPTLTSCDDQWKIYCERTTWSTCHHHEITSLCTSPISRQLAHGKSAFSKNMRLCYGLCAEASCTSAHGPQWRRWRQPKFKWVGSHSRSNRSISWLQTMCAVECWTMQQCSPKSSAAILQDEPPLTAHPAAVDSLQPGPSMLPGSQGSVPISVRNPSPMAEQSPLLTIF